MVSQSISSAMLPELARKQQRFRWMVLVAVMLLLVSVFAAIGVGSVGLSAGEIWQALVSCRVNTTECTVDEISRKIVWDIRLPRIIMALITGAGLSVTGAILQSVTRNPLADPYLFGISSGASLGAVVVMSLAAGSMLSVSAGAMVGAAVSVVLMLVLAGRDAVQVEKLVLSGVAVSFMMGAFTSLILYYSSPETAASLLFWMMGSFSNSQWSEIPLPTLVLLIGLSLFFIYRRWLSAIQAGDESALTLGIPVNQLRLGMLVVSSAITGVLVAHVGGIGFVGLMIPHIARLFVGAQVHRMLLMSLLIGASFMIWVDVMARSLLPNQVLPIGIVTAGVGSVFFFIVLKQRREAGS